MHLIESATNRIRMLRGKEFGIRPEIGLRGFIADIVLKSGIFDWRKEVEFVRPHFRNTKPALEKLASSTKKRRKRESLLNMDDPLDRKIAELLQI